MQKLLSYNYIYLIPLTLSALAGLHKMRLARLKPYRYFILFQITSMMIEIFAISWKWGLNKTVFWSFPKSNLWIYNIFLTIQMLFLSAFYYGVLNGRMIRRIIYYGTLPVACFGLANLLFIQGLNILNSLTIIPYYIIFVLLALSFFHQTLQDKEIIQLRSHPAVWISLGTFIYYSAALPFCIFLPYLIRQNPNLAITLLNINTALDTLMYSFYLTSILCKPPHLTSAS